MISRAAEACFWLQRHMERADSTARMLDVNRAFVLDMRIAALEAWRPLIIVAGEEPRFREIHGEAALEDGEVVQEYLTWERTNPASIASAAYWARENARTIRETISLEMWQSLNSFWLWLTSGPGRRLYRQDRPAFYGHLKEASQLFRGICHDTMSHENPFDFMRLGMLLERAGQTARILDVKHHKLGPTTPSRRETAVDFAQWQATLRSCCAIEPFLKKRRAVTGAEAAGFLLLEETFPRSVLHCLDRARNFLRRVTAQPAPGMTFESPALLAALLDRVRTTSIMDVMASGIHEELTLIIDSLARVCTAIHSDFFDPQAPARDWVGPGTAVAEQIQS